jgi:hypothetical protein
MTETVTFLASFPAIQSAIKITGDGGGMRIQLDIPETEMAEAVKLMLYRQTVLRVTIEPDGQTNNTTASTDTAGNRTVKRSTAKRRK